MLRTIALGVPIEDPIIAGWLHLMYHVEQMPDLYSPSRIKARNGCRFCREFGVGLS